MAHLAKRHFVAEFDSIDKDGTGQILFTEFVEWALSKNADLEDEAEAEGKEEGEEGEEEKGEGEGEEDA